MARIWYGLVWVIAISWFLWATDAIAGGSNDDCNGHGNCNDIDIEVNHSEGGEGGHGGDGGTATATTGDVTSTGGAADATATVGDTYAGGGEGGDGIATATLNGGDIQVAPETNVAISRERQAPNIYLNAGQAERDCGKVIGISGSNTTGGWALGVPIPRSWAPTCDFWVAANEAQQNGHVWLSYHFQCQIRAIRKAWGKEECDTIEQRAWQELGIVPAPEPTGGVYVPEDEYDELLAQASASEQIEEYAEETEYRIAQQQNLIESLQADHEDDQAEIDRLKREAAALRAAQEADEERVEQRQMALQAIYDKRVAQEQEEPPQEEEPPNE